MRTVSTLSEFREVDKHVMYRDIHQILLISGEGNKIRFYIL